MGIRRKLGIKLYMNNRRLRQIIIVYLCYFIWSFLIIVSVSTLFEHFCFGRLKHLLEPYMPMTVGVTLSAGLYVSVVSVLLLGPVCVMRRFRAKEPPLSKTNGEEESPHQKSTSSE